MAKHKHNHRSHQTKEQQVAQDLENAIYPLNLSKVNAILATKPNINNMLGYAESPIFIAAAKTWKPELIRLFFDYAKAYTNKANINIKDKVALKQSTN